MARVSGVGSGIVGGLVAGAVVLAGLGGFALYQKSQADRAVFLAECQSLAAAGVAGLPDDMTPSEARSMLRKNIACMEAAGMTVRDETKRTAGLL